MQRVKQNLFVAIDRATRTFYYMVYDAKTSTNAEAFTKEYIEYFSFKITHVLTDNRLEFTKRLFKRTAWKKELTERLKMEQFLKMSTSLKLKWRRL